MIDLTPFLLSLKISLITTIILFFITLPMAYIFARVNFKFKMILEPLISLPLVLPPVVLGFYILLALSPYSFLGKFLESHFGIRLVFNFASLIIASCIYSLPFMFSPLVAGFRAVPNNIIEASYSLGKSFWQTLFRVIIPNIKPSILVAVITSFAHTMGEFGIVLMIGGNIEGKTKVASIAIFEAVESLDYTQAHIYSLIMLCMGFFVLFIVNLFNVKSR